VQLVAAWSQKAGAGISHKVIWTVKIGQIFGYYAECLPVYMIQVCSKQRFPPTSLQVLLFIET
jgi:hypothetical protein